MATSKNTPKNRLKLVSAPAPDPSEMPLDIVNARLREAHATLDLIHTMTGMHDCSGLHIENLFRDTLPTAVHSCILRIEEALEAAEKIGANRAAVQP